MATETVCPLILTTTSNCCELVKYVYDVNISYFLDNPSLPHDGICAKSKWNHEGVIVVGGDYGSNLKQLKAPHGMFVDDNDAIYVADGANQRVVKWEPGATVCQVVAGGNGKGNNSNQFEFVTKVVVDKNGTMFICDTYNHRVQRWFKDANHGETIVDDILCYGLAMDNEGSLYISDQAEDSVVKWPGKEIVAGGNGKGFGLNQLNDPNHLFVDRDKSVYVANNFNYRVVKWLAGTKEGIIVAGGNEEGSAKNQLSTPQSVVVDDSGTVYVLDYGNDRVTRWFEGSTWGNIILGRPGWGDDASYISCANDLVLDRHGNLYVVDNMNARILKFTIDKSGCSAGKFLSLLLIN
ncbi:unnamed protein product [Rotaria sp. Silwood1]|nr:unnamed protein product [Rotaria sp. Silwood1]CAF3627374.1 unnamed protein product [Rotaria sp. Silwood1]CAF3702055.1 unnamed protein product [Rotaria sp. Silwood1]CAF3719545.1 unnamed protein product [Rotaria sp. Silwood1]CAF4748778.1 unnamed protein product [Rotaria sp. Silwood1]